MSNEPSEQTLGASRESAQPLLGDTVSQDNDRSGTSGDTLNFASFLAPPESADELGWLAHYRVLKMLGRGGMGAVFQAEDTHLRRIVALKVILPESAASSAARERFLREARACAALKNDHVITIYQVGQDRDVPFLAMEFLQGQSLDERLRLCGPLSVSEILRIGREIADGLAAAHANGLIHRDVKPANIWLETQATGPPRVKLLDFGLARSVGAHSGLTSTGDIVGTPEFMSPEQARGKELDARTDLFSLGAVLYLMGSGHKPFPGDSVMAVLTALAVDSPRPLGDFNPNLPRAFIELVGKLLEKDPANRPASAVEVREALAAIEAGEGPSTVVRPQTQRAVAAYQSTAVAGGPTVARRSIPLWLIPVAGLAIGMVLGAFALLGGWFTPTVPKGPPIRIGVLHSQTGTMALSERPVIDAVLLAVEEINARGGVLGRPVEAVLADGQSDEAAFARQAEKLITEDNVCTLFGCWTSASRKAVVSVVEQHKHLLFYPVQFEGMEQSPNVVYLGPVPNQQILPALRLLVGFEGKRRWFLVGSDYVYPITANAVVRAEAEKSGCEVVGEEYLLLGNGEVGAVVKKIKDSGADLIVNTVNGDTNVALFRALRRARVTPSTMPALSTSISEQELIALGPQAAAGDYVAANYFQGLDTPRNREFVARFRKRYGQERVISSAMETAYTGVHLWAKAVETAGRAEPGAIREAVKGQTYDAPQGAVRIDPATLHMVQTSRVGRVDAEGHIVEVYHSLQPIVAEPFPASRSRADWVSFLDDLHKRWGGRWSNPGR